MNVEDLLSALGIIFICAISFCWAIITIQKHNADLVHPKQQIVYSVKDLYA